MAQRRSLVNFCWINGHFNEYMQTGSVWEAGSEWEGRKMNPGIQELLVQRERQVVNDSIHLQDQLNWGLIGRSRKGLSWRQRIRSDWSQLGWEKTRWTSQRRWHLIWPWKITDLAGRGRCQSVTNYSCVYASLDPSYDYLSSQGRRIILELEIRGPELATTACPWDVRSLLWITVYM